MNVHEIMEQALSPLDCYYAHAPVKQRPDTYVAWFEVLGTPALHSSGERRRVEHRAGARRTTRPTRATGTYRSPCATTPLTRRSNP